MDCVSCPLGKYSTVSGASSISTCYSCVAGTYSDVISSTKCQVCPAGKASSATGSTTSSTCVDCVAGTYSSSSSASCQLCPSNTYSYVGQSTCVACPSGSKSPDGSNYCYIESSHPYVDSVSSTVVVPFKVPNIVKYSAIFDTRTSVYMFADGSGDTLCIADIFSNNCIRDFTPSDTKTNFDIDLPDGFVVVLKTNGDGNSRWGFLLKITPKLPTTSSPTLAPTTAISAAPSMKSTLAPVDVTISFEIAGIGSDEISQSSELQLIIISSVQRLFSSSTTVKFLSASSSASTIRRRLIGSLAATIKLQVSIANNANPEQFILSTMIAAVNNNQLVNAMNSLLSASNNAHVQSLAGALSINSASISTRSEQSKSIGGKKTNIAGTIAAAIVSPIAIGAIYFIYKLYSSKSITKGDTNTINIGSTIKQETNYYFSQSGSQSEEIYNERNIRYKPVPELSKTDVNRVVPNLVT